MELERATQALKTLEITNNHNVAINQK
jgi:hypothetical protein